MSGLDLCACVAGSPTRPRVRAVGQNWINETGWPLWGCFCASQFMYVNKFVAQHICLHLLRFSLGKSAQELYPLTQLSTLIARKCLQKQVIYLLTCTAVKKAVFVKSFYIAPGLQYGSYPLQGVLL